MRQRGMGVCLGGGAWAYAQAHTWSDHRVSFDCLGRMAAGGALAHCGEECQMFTWCGGCGTSSCSLTRLCAQMRLCVRRCGSDSVNNFNGKPHSDAVSRMSADSLAAVNGACRSTGCRCSKMWIASSSDPGSVWHGTITMSHHCQGHMG